VRSGFDVFLTLFSYALHMTNPETDPRFPKGAGYQSFLLRYWQNQTANENSWHLSLEDPITREIKVFQNAESLIDYLTQLAQLTQVKPAHFLKEEE
jgi:hypothetical protein